MVASRENASMRTKPLPYWNWNPSVSLMKKPKGARKLAAERRDGLFKDCIIPQAMPGGPHLAPNALAHLKDGGSLATKVPMRRPRFDTAHSYDTSNIHPQYAIHTPAPLAPASAAALINTPQSQAAILAQAQQLAAQQLVAQMGPSVLLAGAMGRAGLAQAPAPAASSHGLGAAVLASARASTSPPPPDLHSMARDIQRLKKDEKKISSQITQAAHQAAAASALVFLNQNASGSTSGSSVEGSRPSSPHDSTSATSVSSP